LGHPCKFQQVSRLGSVTARHSSSGRQPNFAALNRGRHLYLAGRPSRWAFAHILVVTRMWANAQRDGRPVQRRKVWLTPTAGVSCSIAAKMRKPLKFVGVPWLLKPPL